MPAPTADLDHQRPQSRLRADAARSRSAQDRSRASTAHGRPLGPAIVPTYSFVSITEYREYVPTVEQYGERLVEEGRAADSPSTKRKLKAYEDREVMMHRQRLTPDFPPWPSTCFYPMNKKRKVGENWFLLPMDERSRLMAEHGRTGMTFGGKVTQLITVGLASTIGNGASRSGPATREFLKEIVYSMRFDEAVGPLRRIRTVLRELCHRRRPKCSITAAYDHCRV